MDSQSTTTTVQVVERSGMTVERLAQELASSLRNGGWFTRVEATDDFVIQMVDEIVEMANCFGEGAVLERDGEWTRLRDGSDGATNPLNRLAIEELTEHVLDSGPMDILSWAAHVLGSSDGFEAPLLDALANAAWPEAQVLGCAIDWLHHGKLTWEWAGVPSWLQHLDQAEVTEARRCRAEDWEGHLLTVEFDGEFLGTASIGIDEGGFVGTFYAVYEEAQTQIALLKNIQRQHFTPYRKISPNTALRAITKAADVPVPDGAVIPGISWPNSRPLLAFIIEKMLWAGVKI